MLELQTFFERTEYQQVKSALHRKILERQIGRAHV